MYNLTGLAANSTGIVQFSKAVSDVLTEGWLFTVILTTICIIIFIISIYQTGDTKKSFAGAAFLGAIMAMLLMLIGLISNTVFFVYVILGAAAVAFMKQE